MDQRNQYDPRPPARGERTQPFPRARNRAYPGSRTALFDPRDMTRLVDGAEITDAPAVDEAHPWRATEADARDARIGSKTDGSPDDSSATRNRPVIAARPTWQRDLPPDAFAAQRLVVGGAYPELADAIRMVRSQVLQVMDANAWHTLAVVGIDEGEGATHCAANLAVSIAMSSEHSALLVDANLRRPAVHALFGTQAGPGLVDHLTLNMPLERMLVRPGIGHLTIMPAGAASADSTELLASARAARFVKSVRHRYADRIVLFDLPPIASAPDALSFLPLIDAVLVVVAEGKTERDRLLAGLERLRDVNVIGVTLNAARIGARRTGWRNGRATLGQPIATAG